MSNLGPPKKKIRFSSSHYQKLREEREKANNKLREDIYGIVQARQQFEAVFSRYENSYFCCRTRWLKSDNDFEIEFIIKRTLLQTGPLPEQSHIYS